MGVVYVGVGVEPFFCGCFLAFVRVIRILPSGAAPGGCPFRFISVQAVWVSLGWAASVGFLMSVGSGGSVYIASVSCEAKRCPFRFRFWVVWVCFVRILRPVVYNILG